MQEARTKALPICLESPPASVIDEAQKNLSLSIPSEFLSRSFWDFIALYERLGFSIIPLAPKEKRPLIPWEEFQKRKPSEDELKRWFSSAKEKEGEGCPLPNIGIVTGSTSRLVVLDFEDPQKFAKFFQEPPEVLGRRTVVVKTARGYHVYLRPGPGNAVRSFKILPLKLDVKAEGGYVVAPPSIHPSGVPYEFVGDPWSLTDLWTVEDVEAFVWARALSLGAFRYGSPEDPPCIRALLEGVDEGVRNEATMRLGSYWLFFRNLPRKEVLRRLQEWNERNRPPLEDRELIACLDSLEKHGYSYGCEAMEGLGFCHEDYRALCSLKGDLKVRQIPVVFTASATLIDGRIVEEIYREGKPLFAVYDPRKGSTEEVEELRGVTEDGREVLLRPIMNRDLETGQILLPSKVEEYGDTESLWKEVMGFLNRWHEQPKEFERKLDTLYVFLSWVYDAFPSIPYRRALGRWGSGKSAWVETLGSICYRPVRLAGCDSEASLRRTMDLWRGTSILDEADFANSDLYASITKVLCIGYSRDGWYRCCNDKDPGVVESFFVFGPKILATRTTYRDPALESRILTFIATKGTGRAPLYRSEKFREEALRLRNKLLLWRFRNLQKVKESVKILEAPGVFRNYFEASVEPRIAQIILPLYFVVERRMGEELRNYARETSEIVRNQDPEGWLEETVPEAIRAIIENGGLEMEMETGTGSETETETGTEREEKGEGAGDGKKKTGYYVTQVTLAYGPRGEGLNSYCPSAPKFVRKTIPIRLYDIALRISSDSGEPEEEDLRVLCRKIAKFIRERLGFTIKRLSKNKSYVLVPLGAIYDSNLSNIVTHPSPPGAIYDSNFSNIITPPKASPPGGINHSNQNNIVTPPKDKTKASNRIFWYRRVKPSERCELCGSHVVEYELEMPGEGILRRCAHCFEKLRRAAYNAEWVCLGSRTEGEGEAVPEVRS